MDQQIILYDNKITLCSEFITCSTLKQFDKCIVDVQKMVEEYIFPSSLGEERRKIVLNDLHSAIPLSFNILNEYFLSASKSSKRSFSLEMLLSGYVTRDTDYGQSIMYHKAIRVNVFLFTLMFLKVNKRFLREEEDFITYTHHILYTIKQYKFNNPNTEIIIVLNNLEDRLTNIMKHTKPRSLPKTLFKSNIEFSKDIFLLLRLA